LTLGCNVCRLLLERQFSPLGLREPRFRIRFDHLALFDPDPLSLPPELRGNIYHGADGSLIVTMVRKNALKLATTAITGIRIRTADVERVRRITLHAVGSLTATSIGWKLAGKEVVVDKLPGGFVAGLLRLAN
jgi:hypothetical protein